ncbi:MAG TPA: EAL domain-containing protein [Steroidobacteraceae bacterium]|nr:EAL domain-containing protein [Steroidobacteraceae bacterium]
MRTLLPLEGAPDASSGATTTLVRADTAVCGENSSDLHAQLRAQLKEARLRSGSEVPDLGILLRLISAHYDAVDQERRGIVRSMRLMADEAQALAHEAREQSAERLQLILDHIKDVVLTVDAAGFIETLNLTGERVFGYTATQIAGQRVGQLIPRLVVRETAARELWARRKDGTLFPAEIAVSKARSSHPEMFVLCLRDLTNEVKFRRLFDTIAEGVYQSSRAGRLLSVNPAFVHILGYGSAAELLALPSVASLYWNPADRAEFMRRVNAEGEIRNAEFCMRTKDGRQIVILENARAVHDGGDRVTGYEGTIANITERKRAEQAVFAEKERAQVTLQSIGDAVISTDADGRIEYINPVAEVLTGWGLEDARGRPVAEVLNLVNEITREPIENPLVCALGRAENGVLGDHSVLLTRTGQEVAIQESAAPICDRQGRVIGAVIVFHDVTKERRLKRALSYQASHDALTGLINRREFDNRLHAAVMSAQRGEGTYALLYIDLDQFKVVNDTCGHQAGDRLLRDVTGLLQNRVRASDTIARLGGDEFGVLLEGCTTEQSARIADGVRVAIKEYRFVWGASTLSVGASVGVVQIRADTESVAAIMSAADIACYAAKNEGRNRIHVYEADGGSLHREMHWVSRVTRAVEEGRLELYFQPIVRIDRRDAGAFHELLVRLRDDDGRIVPPSEFIPAAERYNVMSVIDRWVVARAIELLKRRHEAGGALPLLAVNLSGTSLNEKTFADFVLQTVGTEPAVTGALCFEITETAAVASLSNVAFFMRELKTRGCKFALDDFGTGLSSFMYLKTLPVDYLKIDGQFITQIATDAVDRSMVEAISKVGRALGIATVAEWVESEAVLEELARIGVDFAQGYHLAQPQPLAQMT